MDTSLTDFRLHCQESILNLLWRQWSSLGVAGHAPPAAMNRLIDPEALILVTSSIGRYDPRLFDEAMDWLGKFGTLINLQRLSNLQHLTALGDAASLTAMAKWLEIHGKQPRWKMLRKANRSISTAIPNPFFLGVGGRSSVDADPIFLSQGYERSPLTVRGMSQRPHPTLAPNLMVSLRALIGVSARVEIILFLAGGQGAHATEIARATGYAPRTLQALLQEMMLSGHLLSQEPEGGSVVKVRRGINRRYHIQPADWAFLTDRKPLPQWTSWAALFSLIRRIISIIPAPEEKGKNPSVISSKIRDALIENGQSLTASGLLPLLDLRPEAPGVELLEVLSKRLPEAIQLL